MTLRFSAVSLATLVILITHVAPLMANPLGGSVTRDTLPYVQQIPILAWYGIPAHETTVERYLEMKEAGFTHSHSAIRDADDAQRVLDVSSRVGIKNILRCYQLTRDPERIVKRFKDHPALDAYFITDEPHMDDFDRLGKVVKTIQSLDDEHYCYINLFPNHAEASQLGTPDYETHVRTFLDKVPVNLLSFDNYPVIRDTVRSTWYDNLEIIARIAKERGIPFGAFVRSAVFNKHTMPSIAEMRLQAYSNLAYGAQLIQHFTYWTPPKEDFNNAPIDSGRRTVVYDMVKTVNREIKDLSGVFMGAEVLAVSHTGKEIPKGTSRLTQLPAPIKHLRASGIGAIVSLLEKGDKQFLAVVNKDFRRVMQLDITGERGVKWVQKGNAVVPADIADGASYYMEPGDIMVFMWEK